MNTGQYLSTVAYFVALLAAIPALAVTWLLLRWYRKSVIRLMNQRGVGEAGSGPEPATPVRPEPPEGSATTVDVEIRRNVVLVVIIGILGGLAFGVLFLIGNDVELGPYRIAFFAALYAWPAVLSIWIVTGARRRWVWSSVAIYFVVFLAISLIAGADLRYPMELWLWSLIPTAAVIGFMARPLRGVGTMVLGVMMAGIVGSQALFLTVIDSDLLLGSWITLTGALGLGDANFQFYGLQVIGFVAATAIGVLAIRLLAGWYARRGFSDQMLLLGSVFFVFAIDYSVTVNPEEGDDFWPGMAIYFVLALVALLLYRVIHRHRADPVSLLVLRVFSPRQGAQRLLDRINSEWRYLGPVRMIGGPDLAIASVEPDEFLQFVLGHLRRLFIDKPATLEHRLSALNTRADPDARYRVEEFFCFDDTWRLTVAQLLARSDVVMMDLRGFGPDHHGCIDELALLGSERALTRTVLLVDAITDRKLLDSILPDDPKRAPTLIGVADYDPAAPTVAACLAAATRGASPS